MESTSYINVTTSFIHGLQKYLSIRKIPLDHVVEVFAGNGELGLQLGLKPNHNVSDLLMHQDKWYRDEISSKWELEPYGVKKESAYQTVLRFYKEGGDVQLLIIGAPPPTNSYYCSNYEMAKALYYCYHAEMLFIGDLFSDAFASPKFFNHVKEVEDDHFKQYVESTYEERGYFKEKHIKVKPHLLRFSFCEDVNCDCREQVKINA
ncbi:hypothetical protein ACTWP4_13230 [Gracilibacillus sp. D59]|uniref:hypothetical protein n=1 Tax=Gracilibacillus sp. D59 TaxID=3457434 RepID=UPI003FCC7D00